MAITEITSLNCCQLVRVRPDQSVSSEEKMAVDACGWGLAVRKGEGFHLAPLAVRVSDWPVLDWQREQVFPNIFYGLFPKWTCASVPP